MEMDNDTESKYSHLGNKLKKEENKGRFLYSQKACCPTPSPQSA